VEWNQSPSVAMQTAREMKEAVVNATRLIERGMEGL
jgi:hypothetical protein